MVKHAPKRSILTPVSPIRPKGVVRADGPPSAPVIVPPTPIARDWAPVLSSIRALLREKRFQEALQVVRAASEVTPGDHRGPLLDGYVQLQIRRFAAASLIGSAVVEQDPWSTDAHMLLALSAKWQGDLAVAVRNLKVITYVMPDCWPAHYFLGTLLQESDPEKALREYAMALRQIDANPDPDGGLGLPLDLPVTDIRFLCERRLALGDDSLVEL
jgi:chemotaxis protein methyltransferase CheR